MQGGRPDRPSSELLEFLRVPSRRIEQLPVPGRPLTVTVGIPTATTTTTIFTHHSTASTAGVVLVTTGVLASAGVPLSTIATPTVYARPAYLLYASHALATRPAFACPNHETVGQPQSTCIDPVRVFCEVYVGQNGRQASVGDQVARDEWDGYAGASQCFECTVRGGLDTRFEWHHLALRSCHSGRP